VSGLKLYGAHRKTNARGSPKSNASCWNGKRSMKMKSRRNPDKSVVLYHDQPLAGRGRFGAFVARATLSFDRTFCFGVSEITAASRTRRPMDSCNRSGKSTGTKRSEA
jgi:hypothetical protein